MLEPRVDFGSGLKGAGITHYRWSYRHLASTNDNDWRVIDAPILRHYRETSLPLSPVIYKSEKIAPAPGITGYYALIDPILPVNGEEWEVLDESFDLASAYFDTTTLVENDAAGNKYELKLELFRNVAGSAVRVDLGVEGIELYEIADPAPLVAGTYSTTLASGDRVLRNAGSVVGYRFIAHLDNRLCSGSIQDVTVNGVAAGPCGFLEYNLPTDAVDIGFIATHPDYFAYFEFGVVRVSTAIKELSASGLVESTSVQDNLPSAVPFTRTVSTFSKQSSVALLMSSGLAVSETQCNRAAFAASLVVRALATDGYVRLSNLDSGNKLKAFAITKA